jgi:hypothetical protein
MVAVVDAAAQVVLPGSQVITDIENGLLVGNDDVALRMNVFTT